MLRLVGVNNLRPSSNIAGNALKTYFFPEYLLAAEMHNATQLKAWGEHFIIVNYDKLNTTALNMLPTTTARSLESRRWPPVWYLLENDWYKKATMTEKIREGQKKHK